MKKLMSGNEAIARGIYEASVKVASAYPGTPSTEILENLANYNDVYSEWAPNEKVAAEVAFGAAVAGVRSVCVMKHVGVNVAADPIFTSSYSGVNAGFVIISADDPGMHSSQNEQDNRHYARAAKLPMFEPADSQDCIDMIKEAYHISEEYDCPVFFRTTTRICHSKSLVSEGAKLEVPIKPYERNAKKYVSVPAVAAARRPLIEKRMQRLEEYANNSPFNRIELNDRKTGVISSGVAAQYAREVFPAGTSYLQLGFTYPLPKELIRQFAREVDTLYVVEELDPFLEEQIRALGIDIIGKEIVPAMFELNPLILRSAILGEDIVESDGNIGKESETVQIDTQAVPRPPVLCPGCPHRGFFYAASKLDNAVIAGDIGCYTLAASDPLLAMDTCVCMGGGFTVAMGMQKSFESAGITDKKVFGVMGDSTFFHSGIAGAIEIIYNGGNVIPVVLDNRTTGMTGQQENPGTGYSINEQQAEQISIPAILEAIGFKKILKPNPLNLSAVEKALNQALESDVPAAIVWASPCRLIKREKFPPAVCEVDRDMCTSCGVCLGVGCPSIYFVDDRAFIDDTLCVGCTVCMQTCVFDAIKIKKREEK